MTGAADTQELIRKIASDHGVVLDRDDPILIVQSATQHVLVQALDKARADQEEVLARHRTDLEGLSSRWRDDAASLARSSSAELMRACSGAIEEALSTALAPTVTQLGRRLSRHERTLTWASGACGFAVIVSVLAAGVAVLVTLCGVAP